MNFLLYALLYLLGWFVCSFAIGNALLLLFFSIPYTKKLNKLGVIENENRNSIIKANIIGTIFQLIIFATITFLVYRFANNYFIGYLIGMIIPFFLLLGKLKESPENISDYIKSFGRCVNIEKLRNSKNIDWNNFLNDNFNLTPNATRTYATKIEDNKDEK